MSARRTPAATMLALVLLAGAFAAGVLSQRPPRPLPPDAPAEVASAGRALRVLREVAREPHRAGTPAQERVREVLRAELAALGLAPETLAWSIELDPTRRSAWLTPDELAALPSDGETEVAVRLTNVLARVPGADSTGTVLLLAHYDSVPFGPGAGDDALGVAALLEALRAVRAGPPLRNDLLVLFTDGEELGLRGARAFADSMDDVAVAVNLEARGNAGPAILFQTGPGDEPLVRLFAAAVERPVATSLAPEVYARMPNDTDFSVFLERGLPGLNVAAIGGVGVYHGPGDTAENVSRATLQHHGDVALGLARALGNADLGALRGRDAVFQDLLGRALVVYPAPFAAPVAVLVLGLVALVLVPALASGRLRGAELAWGTAGAALVALATTALALAGRGAGELLARAVAAAGVLAPAPARGGILAVTLDVLAAAFLGAAAATLLVAAAGRRRADCEPPARPAEPARALAAGGVLLWSALLVAAAVLVPRGSHLVAWPLALALPAAAPALLARRGGGAPGDVALLARAALSVPLLLLCAPPVWLLALVPRTPLGSIVAAALLVGLGTALLQPVLGALARRARVAVPLAAVPALALALAAGLARLAGL